jgi:GNAT superfamily N-acetyltransferase
MSNITYHKEKLFDIKEEIEPILVQHYEEIAAYTDVIELAPDWDRYKTLEEAGILKVMTVRDDGVLVGYYVTMLVPNLHYSKDFYAVNDIVLIKPEYRNAKVGLGLFQEVEKWMREEGASVMTMHMKVKQPFDELCQGLGWDYMERIYTKCIKEV